MEQNITTIQNWLGTGSINIFGLPMSGKDTVGIGLAEHIGAKFLSSGLIIREAQKDDKTIRQNVDAGLLAPTNQFYDLVLPYFAREDLTSFPLILSSIGRWSGEEQTVIDAAESAGHAIKAAILLNISEADIRQRWEQARILQDRGNRADDRDSKILETRIKEFRQKTMPVIKTYQSLGLLIPINADQPRAAVLTETIQKLADFAIQKTTNPAST
jgi:adenylate kinase family enzyme